jgi:hypothetical protein
MMRGDWVELLMTRPTLCISVVVTRSAAERAVGGFGLRAASDRLPIEPNDKLIGELRRRDGERSPAQLREDQGHRR